MENKIALEQRTLISAIEEGDLEGVKKSLNSRVDSNGADILGELFDGSKRTPLNLVYELEMEGLERKKIKYLLIEAGAKTYEEVLEKRNKVFIDAMLVNKRKKINLYQQIRDVNPEKLKKLLGSGVKINDPTFAMAYTNEKGTALDVAYKYSHLKKGKENINLLRNAGAKTLRELENKAIFNTGNLCERGGNKDNSRKET